VTADTLAYLRENEEKYKAQQERLDERAKHELPEVLTHHKKIPQDQRLERRPARDGDGPERLVAYVVGK
jgi:hypothetical protein